MKYFEQNVSNMKMKKLLQLSKAIGLVCPN